jgi:anti-sigma regulatory factor (Ser/Thr protein kinase)
METRNFLAALDHLHEMLFWIRSEAQKMGFGTSELYKIELAAEEAIVNVIHHSYQDKGGPITIGIETSPRQISLTITDQGTAFNPLNCTPVKPQPRSIEEQEVGGLGLLFVHEYLDGIRYQRKNDQNILTLIKKRH